MAVLFQVRTVHPERYSWRVATELKLTRNDAQRLGKISHKSFFARRFACRLPLSNKMPRLSSEVPLVGEPVRIEDDWTTSHTAGLTGLFPGSQQYTARNLKFTNCQQSVQMIWDWGFNWQGVRRSVVSCIGSHDEGTYLLTHLTYIG